MGEAIHVGIVVDLSASTWKTTIEGNTTVLPYVVDELDRVLFRLGTVEGSEDLVLLDNIVIGSAAAAAEAPVLGPAATIGLATLLAVLGVRLSGTRSRTSAN